RLTVSLGFSPTAIFAGGATGFETVRPPIDALDDMTSDLIASSDGVSASTAAESTAFASECPSSITAGGLTANPSGAFGNSTTIGPSKPSIRLALRGRR